MKNSEEENMTGMESKRDQGNFSSSVSDNFNSKKDMIG